MASFKAHSFETMAFKFFFSGKNDGLHVSTSRFRRFQKLEEPDIADAIHGKSKSRTTKKLFVKQRQICSIF